MFLVPISLLLRSRFASPDTSMIDSLLSGNLRNLLNSFLTYVVSGPWNCGFLSAAIKNKCHELCLLQSARPV